MVPTILSTRWQRWHRMTGLLCGLGVRLRHSTTVVILGHKEHILLSYSSSGQTPRLHPAYSYCKWCCYEQGCENISKALLSVLKEVYSEVELLHCIIILFLTFWDSTTANKCFDSSCILIPTNSVRKIQILPILPKLFNFLYLWQLATVGSMKRYLLACCVCLMTRDMEYLFLYFSWWLHSLRIFLIHLSILELTYVGWL